MRVIGSADVFNTLMEVMAMEDGMTVASPRRMELEMYMTDIISAHMLGGPVIADSPWVAGGAGPVNTRLRAGLGSLFTRQVSTRTRMADASGRAWCVSCRGGLRDMIASAHHTLSRIPDPVIMGLVLTPGSAWDRARQAAPPYRVEPEWMGTDPAATRMDEWGRG